MNDWKAAPQRAKFRAGERVRVTFTDGEQIDGRIRNVQCRFLRTPELTEFRYEVWLFRKRFTSEIWRVHERQVESIDYRLRHKP